MHLQDFSLSEIGLQHVLEDGLVALRGRGEIAPDRRELVLDGLEKFFAGASRGFEIADTRSLFVRADEKPAFQAFALIFKYLHDAYRGDLIGRITEMAVVLDQLKAGRDAPDPERNRAADLIEKLLDGLRLERALSPPVTQTTYVNQ